MLRSVKIPLSLVIAAIAAAGCASRSSDRQASNNTGSPGQPGYVAVEASGWDQLVVISGGSEIKFSSIGHWDTSRNDCSKSNDGAMPPAVWDKFATAMNKSVALEPLEKEECVDRPSAMPDRGFRGSAELVVNKKKTPLLDGWSYGKICTTLPDPAVVRALVEALDSIIPATFKQGC